MTLEGMLSSAEVLEHVALFLDPFSAIELTRTSSCMYTALPRNSNLGVLIWKTYLSNERYLSNRLVIETAKAMVQSDVVSRSNYKCILAVLVQKNGFMKITRLKSLCATGKLAHPVLPHKGGWRSLIRLDQFALKRASKESVMPHGEHQLVDIEAPLEVKFIGRIAGQRGKSEMVKDKIEALSGAEPNDDALFSTRLNTIFEILLREVNFAGLLDVLDICKTLTRDAAVDKALEASIVPFRTNLHDSVLHLIVKSDSIKLPEKMRLVRNLLEFSSTKSLVNAVNLNHETALVLIKKRAEVGSALEHLTHLQAVADALIDSGADVYLCDRKGVFYERITSGG